jgi:lactoylglutathione lyase
MKTLVLCLALLLILRAHADEPKRPKILGLSHVALFVHDIDQSRAFYQDYLGFAEPCSVSDPDGKLHLTWIKINDRQTIELFPEKEAGSDRLNHIALEVDDCDAMRLYLASRGIRVPDKTPVGRIGNSNFTIPDPDGHGVEFVQYQPNGWTMQQKGKFLPETRIAARMSHAGILVGELEESLKFYRDILGMRETWRGSRDSKMLSWVNMKVPDGEDYVELMLYDQPVTPERRLISHHICLEVPDVHEAAKTLSARPTPPGLKPATALKIGVNGKRQINLYDPDGTRVEVMEPQTADGKPVAPSTAPAPTTRGAAPTP